MSEIVRPNQGHSLFIRDNTPPSYKNNCKIDWKDRTCQEHEERLPDVKRLTV